MALSRAKTPFFRVLVFVSCALMAAPALVIPDVAVAQPRHGRGGGHGGGWSGHSGGGGHGWQGMRGGFEHGRVALPRNPSFGRAYGPRAWGGGYGPVNGARYRPYGRPVYAQPLYGRPVYRPAVYPRPYGGYRYPGYGYGYGYGGGTYPVQNYGYQNYSYQGYGYPYGYPGYGSYGGYDNGGAAVAGLIGGLALGMIANASVRPAVRRASTHCFYERRRVTLRTGQAVIRRVRSCY